jgi:hypothetical protein
MTHRATLSGFDRAVPAAAYAWLWWWDITPAAARDRW